MDFHNSFYISPHTGLSKGDFSPSTEWITSSPPISDSMNFQQLTDFGVNRSFRVAHKSTMLSLDDVENPFFVDAAHHIARSPPQLSTPSASTPRTQPNAPWHTPRQNIPHRAIHATPSKQKYTGASADRESPFEYYTPSPSVAAFQCGSRGSNLAVRRALHLPSTPTRYSESHNTLPMVPARSWGRAPLAEQNVSHHVQETLPEISPADDEESAETNAHKIRQREKQIGYGKSTKGYMNYVTIVPIAMRELNNDDHPNTPRSSQKLSKRSWDDQLKTWRRLLHRWDIVTSPEGSEKHDDYEDTDAESNSSSPPPFRPTTSYTATLLQASPNKQENSSTQKNSTLKAQKSTRIRSWASECSDTSDYMNLSQVSL